MVKVGEKVAEFRAKAFHKNKEVTIKLSDYKGKWVVMLFYPADFTFVCPTELEEAAKHYKEFQKLGAEILSVSTDTVFVHKAWHDHSPAIKKIEYPMIADPARTLSKQFGTYIDNPEDEDNGLSRRGTFIIDPTGILKAMEIHDNSVGRSTREILRKLQAAVFVSKNKGLVCPASWEPGERTLKPGMDLIGKI